MIIFKQIFFFFFFLQMVHFDMYPEVNYLDFVIEIWRKRLKFKIVAFEEDANNVVKGS